MAKSKHAPALFEMLGQKKDEGQPSQPLSVPKWFKPGKGPDRPQEGRSEPRDAPSTTPSTVSVGTRGGSDDGGETQLVAVRDGRVQVSLNPVSAAVVIGGVFLALFISFLAGKAAGPNAISADGRSSTGIEGVDEPGDQTPDPGVLDVERPKTGEQPSGNEDDDDRLGPTIRRESGLNYIVLEGFAKKDLEAAKHAQTWFKGKGIETTVEEDASGRRLGLVSVLGFESGAGDEIDAYLQQVIDFGKTYRKEFAGKRQIDYHFKSPYAVKWK